jgi:hypothetical protein
METRDVVCWELLASAGPLLGAARRLYETTLDPAERIPWQWIAEAVVRRASWRPGERCPHLLLAARRAKRGPGQLCGFAYGAHIPDYGGYACYLGVDARQRGQGVATRLLRLLVQLFHLDAACEGTPLPFVVWESHRPDPGADERQWALWRARLRLFARVGAYWISGLTFLSPDFQSDDGPPVPLQLFLLPVDTSATDFDAEALRGVAAGLFRRIYHIDKGDPLFDESLPPDCRPLLRPAEEAGAPAE